MSVLHALHASDGRVVVKVVRVEHLLYWVDPPSQETASLWVLSLTVLTEGTHWGRTLVDDVTVLVAAVADNLLRTLLSVVGWRQTELAAELVQTGVVVVAHLLTSEAAHVALEVPVDLLLVVFGLLLLGCPEDQFGLNSQGRLPGLCYFLLQVGSLRLAVDR